MRMGEKDCCRRLLNRTLDRGKGPSKYDVRSGREGGPSKTDVIRGVLCGFYSTPWLNADRGVGVKKFRKFCGCHMWTVPKERKGRGDEERNGRGKERSDTATGLIQHHAA